MKRKCVSVIENWKRLNIATGSACSYSCVDKTKGDRQEVCLSGGSRANLIKSLKEAEIAGSYLRPNRSKDHRRDSPFSSERKKHNHFFMISPRNAQFLSAIEPSFSPILTSLNLILDRQKPKTKTSP